MASLARTYQLYFYPEDNSIEMHDLKMKKVFLKKLVYPQITVNDLYIGSDVSIYSRKMKLIEYGDDYTKSTFLSARVSTYGMIKPDCYLNIGKIMDRVYHEGFHISKLKMFKFSLSQAEEFYSEHKDQSFYEPLIEFMSSDLSVGMEIDSQDAIKQWRALIGPTNVKRAIEEAPDSIRALFGSGERQNAVHGSDSTTSAARELEMVFGGRSKIKSSPVLKNCSCLLIKPHAIAEGNAGKIIDIVLSQGFEISAMEMFYLDKTYAEEFFEVYKGVLPEYSALVEHITSGPTIALEVRQDNVVAALRELSGPHDPDIAKEIRPNTLRAIFGTDRVKNAVHCTDLEEDGVLECQYFFELFQNK
jgi:nucleoside-diphosphate kinase